MCFKITTMGCHTPCEFILFISTTLSKILYLETVVDQFS